MVPGVKISGIFPRRSSCFGPMDLRFDAGDDSLGNLILHCENIGDPTIIPLCEKVVTGSRLDELDRDADMRKTRLRSRNNDHAA